MISRRCAAVVVGEEEREVVRHALIRVREAMSQLPEESRKRVDEAFENAVEALEELGSAYSQELGFVLSEKTARKIAFVSASAFGAFFTLAADFVRRGHSERSAFAHAASMIFDERFILFLAIATELLEKERGEAGGR